MTVKQWQFNRAGWNFDFLLLYIYNLVIRWIETSQISCGTSSMLHNIDPFQRWFTLPNLSLSPGCASGVGDVKVSHKNFLLFHFTVKQTSKHSSYLFVDKQSNAPPTWKLFTENILDRQMKKMLRERNMTSNVSTIPKATSSSANTKKATRVEIINERKYSPPAQKFHSFIVSKNSFIMKSSLWTTLEDSWFD